jgi:hypothetical protein
MPEEGLETRELHEQLEETREHAEHARHGDHGAHGDDGKHDKLRWTLHLSLSTAIVAVFAALSSLQSGANESHALLAKNEAIMAQAKATDQWGYFQAKSTKAAIFEAQADEMADTKPEVAKKALAKRDKYKAEQDEIQGEAKKLEEEAVAHDVEGQEFFHRHHWFALAVTIFQISIAMSAIAALTKRKQLWFVSMAVGAGGIATFALGFLG